MGLDRNETLRLGPQLRLTSSSYKLSAADMTRMVVSNVWWSVALVGWGVLALWGVPQLGAQKAFIPLVIWSYEIATVPWVALLKIAGYDYKKDGGFAIFHLGVFAFGYIIAVFLVLLWGASIGTARRCI